MMEGEHYDPKSLCQFLRQLEDVGFEKLGGTADRPVLRGSIHEAFEGLTDATTMVIAIAPWLADLPTPTVRRRTSY